MKKSISRAVAVTAVCAAGLGGALVAGPVAATATATAAKPAGERVTEFGMKADAFGTKVLVNGVELRNAKDAYARQICTRVTGSEVVERSVASVPVGNELIDLSATRSSTKTYRDGDRTGVRGTSTVGHVTLGGTVPGTAVRTPVLRIDGLVSQADAYFDRAAAGGKGAFRHEESFTFDGITLSLQQTPAAGTPLEDLVDIINDSPADQVATEVVDLLVETAGHLIEIPGLGSIALGKARGRADGTSATSEAYALRLTLDTTADEAGDSTVLQLGRARSRISSGVRSGIFNSQISGLDLLAGDTVRLGNIGQISMPCEGTRGKKESKRIRSATVGLGPASVATLTGIEYRYLGKQLSRGRQRGFVESRLDRLDVPVADLSITGVVSRVKLFRKPGKRTRSTVVGSVAEIRVGDRVIPGSTLRFGDTIEFDGGVIKYGGAGQIVRTFHGARVRLLEIHLTPGDGPGAVLAVGLADGYANRR